MNAGIPTVVLVLLLTSVGACGIFEPRDPAPPAQTGSRYIPPTEPSFVFTNMVNAFSDMNALNYVRSFVDSSSADRNYVFEPTPKARTDYPTVFAEWTRQSEQQFFENARSRVQSGSRPSLAFLTQDAQSIQPDSAQYEVTYVLTIPHAQTNIPKEARGRAVFFMIADKSRNWVIWRWVDIAQAQDDFTWSDFKGQFGQ